DARRARRTRPCSTRPRGEPSGAASSGRTQPPGRGYRATARVEPPRPAPGRLRVEPPRLPAQQRNDDPERLLEPVDAAVLREPERVVFGIVPPGSEAEDHPTP